MTIQSSYSFGPLEAAEHLARSVKSSPAPLEKNDVGGSFLAILMALCGKWASGTHEPLSESTLSIRRITASTGDKAVEEHLGAS